MSSKRNHKPNVAPCTCDKCGATANAPPGKPHRKCPPAKGQENPGLVRGHWQKG